MKTLLLALTIALTTVVAAEEDWRKAAREFMAAHQFAPIEIKPSSRSQADLSRDRWAWLQRVYLPSFEKHLAKWPAQAERARSFVKQALMANIGHPDVDPARPWEVIDKEGAALIKAGVDDPLVLWLTAWAIWEAREGRTDASDFLSRARRHKLLADYPPTLGERIEHLSHECKVTKSSDATAKVHQERTKRILKAAADPAVYGPREDEILFHDVEFAFSTTNARERPAELQKLCDTPHFSPWLREMLHGELQNRIAWGHRGGGFAGEVRGDAWQKFADHQVKARAHFTKAWELRPDRADAAAAMIDIVKCGNGLPGETTRLWFDRALAAQFDHYSACYEMLWALRPRWGGSLDEVQAFFFACALTERFDSSLTLILRQTLDYLEDDVQDIRTLLSRQPMKQVVVQVSRLLAESTDTYRAWQRPWRLADLGLMAWAAGDYETAHDTLLQVPVPFPRQTRRRLHLMANEAEVRAQAALAAFGMTAEWDAAEEIYAKHRPDDALLAYQDMAARFQGEPPGLLLERMAACKFEKAFSTGQWVPLRASPDLAGWHHLSGFWTGLETGTLVNNGHGAQAFLLHNGRTGSNFELMGEYEFKEKEDLSQGLGIILGYHSQRKSEDWITCTQWAVSNDGNVASMLRKFYQTNAPQVVPPVHGRTWKFHIICRNGLVTYRLNHRDIVVDHRTAYKDGTPFEMPGDSVIGFFHHWFHEKSHTHVRRLVIRRLEPPAKVAVGEEAPANLAALREGFARQSSRAAAELHAALQTEAETLLGDLRRERKEDTAPKVEALVARLEKPEVIQVEEMPVPAPGEEWLATLLRGYHASLDSRLATARGAWKAKALALRDTSEAAEISAFISAELEPLPHDDVEEPLAPANALKWQKQSGDWTRSAEVLTGSGDSFMRYDFNRAPPFQIDFEITVLEGLRPRLVMGNVKFAHEENQPTFALYPRPKNGPRFSYEPKKPYLITIKATKDKTELLVDGVKINDGPRIEGTVGVLQFRSGDNWSKGKTEFRKIRISPLP